MDRYESTSPGAWPSGGDPWHTRSGSVGHLLVREPEVVSELVDHRVADLANQFPSAPAHPDQGAAEDRDVIRQLAQEEAVALGEGDPAIETEEVVFLGVETDGAEVVDGRFVLRDDDDVLEPLPELRGQLVEGLLDEGFELFHGDAHAESVAAFGSCSGGAAVADVGCGLAGVVRIEAGEDNGPLAADEELPSNRGELVPVGLTAVRGDRGLPPGSSSDRPTWSGFGPKQWLYRYRKADGKPLTTRTQHNRLSLLRGFFS